MHIGIAGQILSLTTTSLSFNNEGQYHVILDALTSES